MLLKGTHMTQKNLFCSIVGVPNMGKSTLLNRLIGFDLAIISPKAETTRNRITGVLTTDDGIQYVFIDTPGFNKPRTKLDVHLVKMVRDTYNDVDTALFLTEPYPDFTERELRLLDELKQKDIPAILVINKIDRVADEAEREKILKAKASAYDFTDAVCVSALDGTGTAESMEILASRAEEGEHYIQDDTLTDVPEK